MGNMYLLVTLCHLVMAIISFACACIINMRCAPRQYHRLCHDLPWCRCQLHILVFVVVFVLLLIRSSLSSIVGKVSHITLDNCDGKDSQIKTSLTESHGHLIGLSWTAKNIMLSLWYGLTIPVSFWQSLCFSDVWQKAWPNYLQIKSCFLRRRHINDVGWGAAQTVVHVQDRKEAVESV